jgi:hypothetical protein
MERCNECTPLEEAYLSALEIYSATLDSEVVLYRNGDGQGAHQYEAQVQTAGNVLMDAKGKLEDHRDQHQTAQKMQTLRLNEIGRFTSSDGTTFATTYQVAGLQQGDHCTIGFAGENQWRISWHRYKKNIAEYVPLPDVLYGSPRVALEAIRSRLS